MPWSILRLGKEQYFDVELVSTSIATPNILCLFRSIRWTKESGKTFSHTFAWRIYHRQRGIVWHFLMPLLTIDICEMNNLRILLQFYFYDDTIDIETEFDSSEEQHFLFFNRTISQKVPGQTPEHRRIHGKPPDTGFDFVHNFLSSPRVLRKLKIVWNNSIHSCVVNASISSKKFQLSQQWDIIVSSSSFVRCLLCYFHFLANRRRTCSFFLLFFSPIHNLLAVIFV